MFPGRVAAVVRGIKSGKRLSKKDIQEQELKLLKMKKPTRYED